MCRSNADRCKTRVLCFLNISLVGAGRAPPLADQPVSLGSPLAGAEAPPQLGGGLQTPAHISAAHAAACVADNRDVIVGIKVALSRSWVSAA